MYSQIMFPTSCCNSREAMYLALDSGDMAVVGVNRPRLNSAMSFGGFATGSTGSPNGVYANIKDPTMNDCVIYSGTLYQRCLHAFFGVMFLTYVPITASVSSVPACGESELPAGPGTLSFRPIEENIMYLVTLACAKRTGAAARVKRR